MDNRSLFRYIKEFTEIYLSTSNKYDREAACLRLQLPLTILPPRKGDLLVGRIRYLPVGMYPQYEGGGLGYCQDSRAFLRLLQADDLTADEKAELQRLFDFWE